MGIKQLRGKSHLLDEVLSYKCRGRFSVSRGLKIACAVLSVLLLSAFFVEFAHAESFYVLTGILDGSGDGQFNNPFGVAVDTSGNVYVTDTNNSRVQKFSGSGSLQTKWNTNTPFGIAVDPYGYVYTVDCVNNRIHRYGGTGWGAGEWGGNGSGNGQFNSPSGIAVDSMNWAYVVDTANNRIQKLATLGVFETQWGAPGSGDGQFNTPKGIAADGSGNVYVADSGIVVKFSNSGVFITRWGRGGTGNGTFNTFNQPWGIAVDTSGNVYVADCGNNSVQKFSSSGTFITRWGSTGDGDGQFNGPWGVAVDASGNVYVADSRNNRVQKFSSSGTFITKWGSLGSSDSGQFNSLRGVAVDSWGNVYVTDTDNQRVQKFSSSGTFIAKWGRSGGGDSQFSSPCGIAVDGLGNVYVTEIYGHRVQKFSSSGTFITKWGHYRFDSIAQETYGFQFPYGIAVDAAGSVYVADSANNRVAKFTPLAVPTYNAVGLVVRGLDNRIYYRTNDSSTGNWASWNALPNGYTSDSPASAIFGGKMHFVVRGTDGDKLWHSSVSLSDGAFSGWTQFINYSTFGLTPSAPTLASDGNIMCVVVRSQDNRIYYCMYNGEFGEWTNNWLGLPSGLTCDSPAATILNGNLHIVVRSIDGLNIWHGYVELATGSFSGWTWVGGYTQSAPTLAACTSRGEVVLVVRGLDNVIYRNSWSPSGWAGWSALPFGLTCDGPGACVVGDNLQVVVEGVEGSHIWASSVNLSTGAFSGWTLLDGLTQSKPTLFPTST